MIWFEVSIGRGAEALVIPGLFVFQVIRIEGFIKGQKSRKLLEKLCAIVTHQQTRQATKTYIKTFHLAILLWAHKKQYYGT
jgi:hypothetical protein